MDKTNEFSFILKPSAHGVGVFAAHDINKGTHLKLFGSEDTLALRSSERDASSVPKVFQQYCMNRGKKLICPKDFSTMSVGWYLNHSQEANATRDENYTWYAAKDLKSGEEILIDYNLLEEPVDAQEHYYKK